MSRRDRLALGALALAVPLVLVTVGMDAKAKSDKEVRSQASSRAVTAPAWKLRQQLRRERLRHRAQMRKLRRELREAKTSPVYYRSPRLGAWLCIHKYEGAWNDPNAPYYGGLQMNWDFMRAYGSEFLAQYGTADNWPPGVQMYVADRAWKVRGFNPWPTTARACGLL